MSKEFKLQDSKSLHPSYQPHSIPSTKLTPPPATGDDWNKLAREYKEFSSGPGTAAIKVLVERTNQTLPFAQATAIHDNGCGPGPITAYLIDTHGQELSADCSILASDFSEGMIKQVESSKEEALAAGGAKAEQWKRVQTKVLDATDLQGVPEESKSHVLAGWVYFMTPDPQKCLTESLRVLKPEGVLACTSWEGSEWLSLMYTLSDVRPDLELPSLPEKWSDVGLLKKEFEVAGFKDVQSERVLVKMKFEKHETLVNFLLEKLPHAIAFTKQMTEDEVRKWKELCVAKCKEFCPDAPGELSGWSLMAIGRK
jgi:ubiquinone/menaquinone biosynthesis C-methylase UbiE